MTFSEALGIYCVMREEYHWHPEWRMFNFQLLFTSLTRLNGGFACESSDDERASDKPGKQRRTHDFVLCAMWHIGPYLRDFQDVRRGWMLFLELERTKTSELGESGHV